MKLYERIENNNFDEIDKNRAIELIEGGNGHLVYNEDYFKLQKENEELNNRCRNLDKEAQAYLEELAGDNTLTRRTIKQLQEENEELKQDRNNNYQMIALAQNEALGYMQGYEDGKKLKRSAIANIVENQRYYILNEQIEYYKEYIEELRKKNEQLRTEVNSLKEDIFKSNMYDEEVINYKR